MILKFDGEALRDHALIVKILLSANERDPVDWVVGNPDIRAVGGLPAETGISGTGTFQSYHFTIRKIQGGHLTPITNPGFIKTYLGAVNDLLMGLTEHAAAVYLSWRSEHWDLFIEYGETVQWGQGHFVVSGALVFRVDPTGDQLGKRGDIAIHQNGYLVQWVYPKVGNGNKVIDGGQIRNASEPFAPNELLPVRCHPAGKDAFSLYWHPTERKIKKLKRSVLAMGAVDHWVDVLGLPGYQVGETRIHDTMTGVDADRLVVKGPGVGTESDTVVLGIGDGVELTPSTLVGGREVKLSLLGLAGHGDAKMLVTGEGNDLAALIPIPYIGSVSRTTIGNSLNISKTMVSSGPRWYSVIREHTGVAHAGMDGVPTDARRAEFTNGVGILVKPITTRASENFTVCEVDDALVVFREGRPIYWDTRDIPERTILARAMVRHFTLDPFTGDQPVGEVLDEAVNTILASGMPIESAYTLVLKPTLVDSNGVTYLGLEEGFLTARSNGDPSLTTWVPRHNENSIDTCSCCGDEVYDIARHDITIHFTDGREVEGSICACCMTDHQGGFFECSDCSEIYANSTVSELDEVCQSCYETNYDACDRCGEHTHTARMVDGLCAVCSESTGSLREYNYRPKLVFYRTKPEELLCYGVEIELEDDGTHGGNRAVARAANEVLDYPGCKNFMIAKRDGSLQQGAEFVTQPFSWEWFKENKSRFKDIFNEFREHGFTAKRTCGLHIHVSRKPHTSVQEFRLMQLVYGHPRKWLSTSGRPAENHYCALNEPHTGFKERVRVARERGSFSSRYAALNPTSKDTLEWRLWAGTDRFSTFAASLAITAGAHAFARSGAVGIKPSWDKFKKFVSEHSEFGAFASTRLAAIS